LQYAPVQNVLQQVEALSAEWAAYGEQRYATALTALTEHRIRVLLLRANDLRFDAMVLPGKLISGLRATDRE